jgi:hypothetical protein
MTVTARDVLTRVQSVLQDPAAKRWTLPGLFVWINDATREIMNYRPELGQEGVTTIPLTAGSIQTLPPNIARIVRYLSAGDPVTTGAHIELASEMLADAQFPGWRGTRFNQSDLAAYVVVEDEDDSTFNVIPPNTGNGTLNVVALIYPDDVDAPANPNEIASYAAVELPLADEYRTAYVEFVLARAFNEDGAHPAAASRSQSHFNQFLEAMGQQVTIDGDKTPKKPTTQPQA